MGTEENNKKKIQEEESYKKRIAQNWWRYIDSSCYSIKLKREKRLKDKYFVMLDKRRSDTGKLVSPFSLAMKNT